MISTQPVRLNDSDFDSDLRISIPIPIWCNRCEIPIRFDSNFPSPCFLAYDDAALLEMMRLSEVVRVSVPMMRVGRLCSLTIGMLVDTRRLIQDACREDQASTASTDSSEDR